MKHFFSYPVPEGTLRLVPLPLSVDCSGLVAEEIRKREPEMWEKIQSILKPLAKTRYKIGDMAIIDNYAIIFVRSTSRSKPQTDIAFPSKGRFLAAPDNRNDELIEQWVKQGHVQLIPLELI